MTTKDIEFHNSYLAELTSLKRTPAPQIICRYQNDYYIIPTNVTALSETHYAQQGHQHALDYLSSDHEITIAVLASDDEKGLAQHLLNQHVHTTYGQGNVTTVDHAAELIDKVHDLCDSPGVILYNVGSKLVQLYGEKPPLSILEAILSKARVSG